MCRGRRRSATTGRTQYMSAREVASSWYQRAELDLRCGIWLPETWNGESPVSCAAPPGFPPRPHHRSPTGTSLSGSGCCGPYLPSRPARSRSRPRRRRGRSPGNRRRPGGTPGRRPPRGLLPWRPWPSRGGDNWTRSTPTARLDTTTNISACSPGTRPPISTTSTTSASAAN